MSERSSSAAHFFFSFFHFLYMQHCLDIRLSVGGCTVRVGAALQHDDAMVDKGKKSNASSFGLVLLLQQLNGGGVVLLVLLQLLGINKCIDGSRLEWWCGTGDAYASQLEPCDCSLSISSLPVVVPPPLWLYLRMQNSFLVIIIIYIDRTRFIAKRKRALWICSLQPALYELHSSIQSPLETWKCTCEWYGLM